MASRSVGFGRATAIVVAVLVVHAAIPAGPGRTFLPDFIGPSAAVADVDLALGKCSPGGNETPSGWSDSTQPSGAAQYGCDGNDASAMAFAGSSGTTWPQTFGLGVDLGAPMLVSSFRIAFPVPGGDAAAPGHWRLKWSDTPNVATGTVVYEQSFWPASGADTGRVWIPPVTARYWNLEQGTVTSAYGARVHSIELYETGTPPATNDLARGRCVGGSDASSTGWSSATQSWGPGWYGCDGRDDTTVGFTGASCGTTWDTTWALGVDLGTERQVSSFRVAFPVPGGPAKAPGHWRVKWSTIPNVGSGTTVHEEPSWPASGTDTGLITFPAATARYWILEQGTVSADYCARVHSFELYAPSGDAGSAHPEMYGYQSNAAFTPDPVNLATGVFTAQAEDLALPGRVLGLSFARWYNSADTTSGPLGPAWTHTYSWKVTDSGGSVEVRRGDGRRDTFMRNPDGTYANPPDMFDTLAKNPDGTYTLTLVSQVAYDFAPDGLLFRIREPAGNAVTLSYAGGDLTTITDTVGRQVLLRATPATA